MAIEAELEKDIDWRMAELAALRLAIATVNTDAVRYAAGLRALWVMLYAHYEGFCKYALDLYLGELERCSVARAEFSPSLAQFSLDTQFKKLRGDTSSPELWRFFTEVLPTELAKPAVFETKADTNGNLYPSLLKQHCDTLNLHMPSLEDDTAKLKTLVKRRNEIAHGKKNVISSIEEYAKYEVAVTNAIYELALSISSAVENRSFLAPPDGNKAA